MLTRSFWSLVRPSQGRLRQHIVTDEFIIQYLGMLSKHECDFTVLKCGYDQYNSGREIAEETYSDLHLSSTNWISEAKTEFSRRKVRILEAVFRKLTLSCDQCSPLT